VFVCAVECRKAWRYSQQLSIRSYAAGWSDEQFCATAAASQ